MTTVRVCKLQENTILRRERKRAEERARETAPKCKKAARKRSHGTLTQYSWLNYDQMPQLLDKLVDFWVMHIAHTMGEQTNESALHAVANSTKTRFKQCNSHSTLFNKCSILRVESVKFHCARACVDVVLYVSHRHRHAYSAHFERRLKTEHNHCERILSSSSPSTARSYTHSLFSIRLRISVIQPHGTHIDREIRAKASPTSFHSHRTRKN